MKICILSDSHDNRDLLAAAVRDARRLGAEVALHCGDVVAANTLRVFQKLHMPVHVIHGNNTGDLYTLARMAHEPGSVIHFHGQDAGITLHGRSIFLVHYPHYARAMACTGEWDIVCCGHDHRTAVAQVENIRGGKTWLVNPGTVGGVGASPTWILGDLEAMSFVVHPIRLDQESAA
jgi:putative phosphoesterase